MFAKSRSGGKDPGDLAALKNLGPVIAARLSAVGVLTPEDLRRLGAIDAYVRLKRAFPLVTNNVTLYSLHGAVTGTRLPSVTDATRTALRDAVVRRL
jgi:DNA transformation protein